MDDPPGTGNQVGERLQIGLSPHCGVEASIGVSAPDGNGKGVCKLEASAEEANKGVRDPGSQGGVAD